MNAQARGTTGARPRKGAAQPCNSTSLCSAASGTGRRRRARDLGKSRTREHEQRTTERRRRRSLSARDRKSQAQHRVGAAGDYSVVCSLFRVLHARTGTLNPTALDRPDPGGEAAEEARGARRALKTARRQKHSTEQAEPSTTLCCAWTQKTQQILDPGARTQAHHVQPRSLAHAAPENTGGGDKDRPGSRLDQADCSQHTPTLCYAAP